MAAPTPEPGFRLLGPDEVLQEGDRYYSPYGRDWFPASVTGSAVSKLLTVWPKSSWARRVQPAFQAGQTVEVLGGVPWCRNGNGEWVRDFSRPLLAGGEQYRTVREARSTEQPSGYRALVRGEVIQKGDEFQHWDGRWGQTECAGEVVGFDDSSLEYRRPLVAAASPDAVLLDDGYEYPAHALRAVQAKWRPWLTEEALGKQVYRKENPKALMLVNEAHACGVFMWSSRKVLVYGVERVQYSRVYQSYEELLADFEQLDGSPCGVLEGYEAI